MLEALRKLGEIRGGPAQHDVLSASHIIIVDISFHTGEILGVSLRNFESHHAEKCLYTQHSANRTPVVPTIKIALRDLEKAEGHLRLKRSLYQKMKRSITRLSKAIEVPIDSESVLSRIEMEIGRILSPKITGLAATLTFNGKFMSEIPVIQEHFGKSRRKRASKSFSKGICAVCGKIKEVSGDISPFTFYTIDKPGYVVGGFDKSLAYKAFPLCYDCRDLIQRGRQHVEENLKFSFVSQSHIQYLLIPDFIFGTEPVHQEVLDILTKERTQRQRRLHSLKHQELRRITDDEEDILSLLSEEQDVMTFHFLFMTHQQSRETIELYIQDVYPSRLRALLDAKVTVERLMRLPREDGTWREYTFTYATVYRFFSKADPTKRDPDLLRHFYDLVDRTFRGVPVSIRYLIPFLVRQIRHDVVTPDRRDQGQYRFTIQDALATLLFVQLVTQ
ncbi:MAG: hypothetical protein J7M05_03480, partial [Anaerolineae bacterium]|nr:hypothetical protein [Anaerolineae bacterium]